MKNATRAHDFRWISVGTGWAKERPEAERHVPIVRVSALASCFSAVCDVQVESKNAEEIFRSSLGFCAGNEASHWLQKLSESVR